MRLIPNRKNIPYIAVFVLYAALTLIGALRHELWYDEAQAWDIVRDSDLAGILNTLRYEGHPPLWYMVLLPFARLGFSCGILPLISWFFSALTVFLILWRAPFGFGMKTAVVFSGGFLFFNSAISRVYCLIPFLLCLIAILYPKRKKRPILFGLLIALLANTHVCFCGMVGIFGIYMLTELFREWRGASARENAGRLIGLGIAGIGVLLLVLPLLDSIRLNASAANIAASMTLGHGLFSFLTGLDDAMYFCVTGTAYPTEFLHPIASLAAVGLGLFLILFRRWKKQLAALLVFLFFYLLINTVVWWNNPSRASVLLYAFVFFLWFAFGEGGEAAEKAAPAWLEQLPRRIAGVIRKIREAPRKSLSVILTAVLFTTVPVGAFYLVSDVFGSFCPVKEVADYIRANYDPETLLVCYGDDFPTLSAYLPEYPCYSVNEGAFYTFRPRVEEKEVSAEQVARDLAPYEKTCEVIFNGFVSESETLFWAESDVLFPHATSSCAVLKPESGT